MVCALGFHSLLFGTPFRRIVDDFARDRSSLVLTFLVIEMMLSASKLAIIEMTIHGMSGIATRDQRTKDLIFSLLR